jgi:hypothetical protein
MVGTVINRSKKSVVWYDLSSIDGGSCQPTQLKVKVGVNIDSLKTVIKERHEIVFQNVDAPRITFYDSAQDTEPIDSRMEWNTDEKWGTTMAPLIVKVNQLGKMCLCAFKEKINQLTKCIVSALL